MTTVGFIGLGNVGAKLAGSLLRNDIELTVHDLTDSEPEQRGREVVPGAGRVPDIG